jgi:hypothetical protein
MVPRFLGDKYKKHNPKDLVVRSVRRKLNDPHFLEKKKQNDREALCDAVGIALAAVMLAY